MDCNSQIRCKDTAKIHFLLFNLNTPILFPYFSSIPTSPALLSPPKYPSLLLLRHIFSWRAFFLIEDTQPFQFAYNVLRSLIDAFSFFPSLYKFLLISFFFICWYMTFSIGASLQDIFAVHLFHIKPPTNAYLTTHTFYWFTKCHYHFLFLFNL